MNRLHSGYTSVSTKLLIIYLAVILSGCTTRPAALNPEAAKALQTREFNAGSDDLARAVVMVLQEMQYSLDNTDLELGIITATRISERSLAPISREVTTETGMSEEMQTFCVVAAGVAIVAILFAWLWDDDDDDEDDDREEQRSSRRHRSRPAHHHNNFSFWSSEPDLPNSFQYTITLTIESISPTKSLLRTTIQGEEKEGGAIVAAGPVQDSAYYQAFYTRLAQALN